MNPPQNRSLTVAGPAVPATPARDPRATASSHALVSSGRSFAVLLGTILVPLAAQTTPPPAATSDETVQLSPFEVRANAAGIYQVSEALAGGRVRTNLFESTSDISIVTSELMADVAPRDIFSAAKYLAGIANNSSQVAGDRVSIRGFQVSNPDIDGFATPQSVVKQDPALYERIEFVRGPDALLSPSGSPGGTLNLISKTARFDDFGSATGQVGEYDTDAASFDLNRTAGKTAAYRVVGSLIDATQGDNQGYHRSYSLMPSALFKIGDRSQLLFHVTLFWGNAYNYLGFPIDPATSATTSLHMLPGLDVREKSYADSYGDPSSANHTDRMIYRTMFTSRVTDNLSVRVAARYLWEWETNNQWNLLGNSGGGYDPNTGQWTPGLVWTSKAPFVSSPAPAISSSYNLSQSPTNILNHTFDVQNDYVYQFATSAFNSETMAGVAGEAFNQKIKGYNATSPAINILAIPSPATWTVSNTASTDQQVSGNWGQVYASEKLKFWNNHFIVNGSLVPTWFYEKIDNHLSGLSYATHPHPTFVNYGVDIVPVPYASIFFGHSEDAAQIVNAPTASNPNPPQLQSGKQNEVGLRLKFLDGRATASVAYYELHQTNNVIVNPALFSVPPPTVFPPPILANRNARGWEYELNLAVTKELSVVANFTNYRNRSPYGVPFRANPETAGAVFANYRFLDGSLKGLGFGVGYSYQGKAAGDSASGVTNASTPTSQIPNQPSFYLPAYGLLNLMASYRFDPHWTVRVFVDNALNKTYYAGSLNRNAVMPGIPTNFRAAVTYSF